MEVWIGFDFTVPFALQEGHDALACLEEVVVLRIGRCIQLLKGMVLVEFGILLAIGKTPAAPVPEAAVEFVDDTGQLVVTVDLVGSGGRVRGLFATIVLVRDAAGFSGIDGIHSQTILFPGEPMEDFGGLIGLSSLSTPWRFDGDGVLGEHHQYRLQAAAMVTFFSIFRDSIGRPRLHYIAWSTNWAN